MKNRDVSAEPARDTGRQVGNDWLPAGHTQRMLQVTAELIGDPNETMEHAIAKTCVWLKKNHDIRPPPEAWQGEAFNINASSAKRVEAVRIDAQDYWALRFDDPDTNVPQRAWVTEVTVARKSSDGPVLFGLRLTCVSGQGGHRPDRTVPRVVREITRNPGLSECGWRLGESYTDIYGEDGVVALTELLTHPERRRPVFVFAPINNPEAARERAQALARATPGASHVVVLDEEAAWALSEQVGRHLSVFGDAARTYVPGFHPGDDPYRHPLMLPETQAELASEGELVNRLTQSALITSTHQRDWRDAMPSFADVKEVSLRERRQSIEARSPDGGDVVRDRLHEEIEYLKARHREDLEASESLIEEEQARRQALEQDNARLRQHAFNVECQLDNLRNALRASGQEVATEPEEAPRDYQTLLAWAESYLSDRLEITTRAERAVKDAPPEQLERSWQALRLLANEYRRMRLGEDGALEAYQDALKREGLEDTPALAGSTSEGVSAGNYTVINSDGERLPLERHLKKGKSHDKRECFRLYFSWDGVQQKAVVGPFPEHLPSPHT